MLRGQVGVREGEWVQVSNYNVCMTHRCWGGRSALCAVEGWVGKYLLLIGLMKASVSC